MAELYAQKLDISDDRIKTMSIAEPTFTTKSYAESATYFTSDAGVRIGSMNLSLEQAQRMKLITAAQKDKSPSTLEELRSIEYTNRADQAELIKNGAATANDRAAGEIIEQIARDRVLELNVKYYAKNYLDHLVRAVKMQLVKRDPSITKEKEQELDKRAQAVKALNAALILKYSKTKTFADRTRKISAAAAKELSAPFEQSTTFKYEGK